MDIETIYGNRINQATGLENIGSLERKNELQGNNGTEFQNFFQTAMNRFNESQGASEAAIHSLVLDDGVPLHDIMIQTTEAQLSLELAIQVRNKCLEAYNDIKNMQF